MRKKAISLFLFALTLALLCQFPANALTDSLFLHISAAEWADVLGASIDPEDYGTGEPDENGVIYLWMDDFAVFADNKALKPMSFCLLLFYDGCDYEEQMIKARAMFAALAAKGKPPYQSGNYPDSNTISEALDAAKEKYADLLNALSNMASGDVGKDKHILFSADSDNLYYVMNDSQTNRVLITVR